jgi:diguanylate cyclase (GGDEF)-like protein
MQIAKLSDILALKDVSIRHKLLFFALGGLAWFLIISLVALGSITYVKHLSRNLTDRISPQMQTTQKAIIKLRGANVSVHNLAIYEDENFLKANVKRADTLLGHVNSYLHSLLEGGHIKDYSDLTGELIEEFPIVPVQGDKNIQDYIKTALDNNKTLKSILDELTSISLRAVKNGGFNESEKRFITKKLNDYDLITMKSVTSLSKLTSHLSISQKEYIKKMNSTIYTTTLIIIFIVIIAIILLFISNHFVTASMIQPIKAITEQIKDLSEGEIDLSRQITVNSKDEIGIMSSNFNTLMHTIYDINNFKKVIEEDDELEDVYTRLAKVFKEDLKLEHFIIYEVSNSKNTMRAVDTPFTGREISCNKEILINCNLCRSNKTGHTVSSLAYPYICKQFLKPEEFYHICIPMMSGVGTGGVVQFIFHKGTRETETIQKRIMRAQQYIKEAIPVIEAKRLTGVLKESSVKDQLTGLYNRRFLEEYIDTLVARVTRKKEVIGLLMCDLDFFKEVNDKFGHDVGDTVLKETANILSKNARASDLVVRFGGEEFLVLLVDAKEGEAIDVAERIRRNIEEHKIKIFGAIIQKTISIGVSEFLKDTENFWESIKYADIALYRAKEMGRNRVVRFTKDMWTEEEY